MAFNTRVDRGYGVGVTMRSSVVQVITQGRKFMSVNPRDSANPVNPGRAVNPGKALNLGSKDFSQHKYEYYAYLREHLPVAKGRVAMLKLHLVSRYADCMDLVKDPRFARNRT